MMYVPCDVIVKSDKVYLSLTRPKGSSFSLLFFCYPRALSVLCRLGCMRRGILVSAGIVSR